MGFRNGLGTREALFGINISVQRARYVNREVDACFIDFQKAFDRVNHKKPIQILRNSRLDAKDFGITSNSYWR